MRLGRRASHRYRRADPPRRLCVRVPVFTDELPGRGITAGENRSDRLCSVQRIFSVLARKPGLSKRVGPPSTMTWSSGCSVLQCRTPRGLTDITEHRTDEGKLDLCAVKDLNSNRIVGYSIDSRMEASLAVSALRNAVALRGRPPAAGRRQVPGPVTAQPVSSGEATAGAFAAEIGDALCGWSGAAKEAVQLGA